MEKPKNQTWINYHLNSVPVILNLLTLSEDLKHEIQHEILFDMVDMVTTLHFNPKARFYLIFLYLHPHRTFPVRNTRKKLLSPGVCLHLITLHQTVPIKQKHINKNRFSHSKTLPTARKVENEFCQFYPESFCMESRIV